MGIQLLSYAAVSAYKHLMYYTLISGWDITTIGIVMDVRCWEALVIASLFATVEDKGVHAT